ncbi:uncharacterized protein AB675_8220 [Cyphellophora attinorum]|uniref:AMP-activated protein kinase glycogen-binding domain-containing protein n=1 Tax=Cyphellophora attinorum TaxID=1664694 RepID=A0A0N1H5S1_9EURO|nr:uncharacterized protein AB675_8220 [Phialophora attinorum]KPI41170.1 hypothetical protein AB675_8220 [Phialophora attinorum]
MGSFLFKWPHSASEVYVTGTFDDWAKSEKLEKVGDVFQKEVVLKDADTKILYKFVVDGNWTTDHEGPKEDDGSGNVNNVLHPEQITKASAFRSGVGPESTTAGLAGAQPFASAPGAFPETPANEAEPSFGVAPIPASSGAGNPVNVPAGDKVPESVTADAIGSNATTSKEAYDNAGSSEFPGTSGEEKTFGVNPIPASEGIGNPVSTKPGEGLPEQVRSAHTVDSTVTTSKEDYEKAGTNYGLPAAGAAVAGTLAGAAAAIGIGKKEDNEKQIKNLIPESSLPMGADAGTGADAGPHISSVGPGSTTAALAANVPLESSKVADGVPEQVKESLAEAHQSAEAAASPEAVKEKSALEKELLSKTSPVESTSEDAKVAIAGQSSYHGLATSVPKPVEESIAKSGASPEAAADPSVVAEKTALERELAQKVPTSEATGEPAPVVSAETSAVAPAATGAAVTGAAAAGAAGIASSEKTAPGASSHAAAAVSDGAGDGEELAAPKTTTTTTDKSEGDATEYAPPPTGSAAPGVSSGAAAAVSDGADPGLADEPAVKMMNQNETGDLSATDGAKDEKPVESTKETTKPLTAATGATAAIANPTTEAKATAPTSTTSTPTKKPAATPESSPATKEKKKKNRISSFFKKIMN